jgi:hypothetical protein
VTTALTSSDERQPNLLEKKKNMAFYTPELRGLNSAASSKAPHELGSDCNPGRVCDDLLTTAALERKDL